MVNARLKGSMGNDIPFTTKTLLSYVYLRLIFGFPFVNNEHCSQLWWAYHFNCIVETFPGSYPQYHSVVNYDSENEKYGVWPEVVHIKMCLAQEWCS